MKKKLFIFLLVLLFPSLLYAATPADTIYTWGYGDILAKALHGVADVVGSGGFETIFKIFLGLSLFSSFISLIFSIGRRVDYFSVFKMWIFGSMIFTLLFTVKIPVAVEDVSGFSQVVNDVPWLIGKPLAFFSQIEERMGEIVEQAFFPTTSFIGYNQLGPVTPLAMVAGEVQATTPVDPYLYKSINNYVKDCVIPDILDGSKSLITLQSSHTLWTDLGNTNPARFTVIYDSTNPDGTVYDCPSAYGVLDSRVKVYAANDGLDVLSNSLGFVSSSIVASSLGLANDYFMSYSASAQDAILQGIAINQMKSGYREWAIAAGVNPDTLSYSLSTATEQLKQTSLAKAITGAKYLPMAKGVGTAFFVAMLPFMIVISLFSGPRAFKVVLTVYVWFLLWHIGEVVLNAFLLTSAQNQLSAIAAGGPTLMSAANVAAASQDKIIAFSSFYWLIPTISFGLASGAAYAFSSVASGIMGAASGAAAAGAAEAAKGSASFGNLAYGNVSSNNIDWLHRENMGTETRMDLLNYSMNGRRSISTAFANRMNAGGTVKEQIANQSVSAFGLPGIPGRDKFIDGEAVYGDKGVTIHGKTAGGWNVDGLIDKNGRFTGVMKTGNREVQYDHGTPIKEKILGEDGSVTEQIGDAVSWKKAGGGFNAVKGTVTAVSLSSAAIKNALTAKEQLSERASDMWKKGQQLLNKYTEKFGIDRGFSDITRAGKTVENGSEYSEEVKQMAKREESSAIEHALEDLVKSGEVKKSEVQAMLNAGVSLASIGTKGVILRSKDNRYEIALTGKTAQKFKEAFVKNYISSQNGRKVLKEAERGSKDKEFKERLSSAISYGEEASEYLAKAHEYREEAAKMNEKSLSAGINVLPEAINNYLDNKGITDKNARYRETAEIVDKMNKLFATDPQKGIKYLNRISGGDYKALEDISKMKVDIKKPQDFSVKKQMKEGQEVKEQVKKGLHKGQDTVNEEYSGNSGKNASTGVSVLHDAVDPQVWKGHIANKENIEMVQNLLRDSFNRRGLTYDKDKIYIEAWNNDAKRIFPAARKAVDNKMLHTVLEKMQGSPDKKVKNIDENYMKNMKPGEVVETESGLKVAKLTPGTYLTYSKDAGYSVLKYKDEEKEAKRLKAEYVNPDGSSTEPMTEAEWKEKNKLNIPFHKPDGSENPKDLF